MRVSWYRVDVLVGVSRRARLPPFDRSDSGACLHGNLLSLDHYGPGHAGSPDTGLLGFPFEEGLAIGCSICFDGAVLVMAGEAHD
jgi:hypothetical protein